MRTGTNPLLLEGGRERLNSLMLLPQSWKHPSVRLHGHYMRGVGPGPAWPASRCITSKLRRRGKHRVLMTGAAVRAATATLHTGRPKSTAPCGKCKNNRHLPVQHFHCTHFIFSIILLCHSERLCCLSAFLVFLLYCSTELTLWPLPGSFHCAPPPPH